MKVANEIMRRERERGGCVWIWRNEAIRFPAASLTSGREMQKEPVDKVKFVGGLVGGWIIYCLKSKCMSDCQN